MIIQKPYPRCTFQVVCMAMATLEKSIHLSSKQVGEDQFEQLIPVACDVIGSPLNFQIAKDQAPFVR